MNNINITFYGGVGSVTGANFLVEGNNFRFLVDCGLVQGSVGADEENKKSFEYDPGGIDYLFITHAHIDHIGRIPKLVHDGFHGTIYSTPETKEIAELMLTDAAHIMDMESRSSGTLPLYSPHDVTTTFTLWKTIPYHSQVDIQGKFSVFLKDAGHILGSSMYIFTLGSGEGESKKILFTGDLGNSPSILLPDTEFVDDVNYIVMDSVYGDRNHESKDERDERFKEVLLDTITRRATLVIPAFSLERTQTILYEINNLVEEKIISSVPVFLDSPLAIKLTEIYKKMHVLFNENVQRDIEGGDKIFQFPKLIETALVQDSKKIDSAPSPKIIIAGSGMSTAGRVLHHEQKYLPDKNATLLLMGYQAPGTLGRELQEGKKEVVIKNERVEVKARIVSIEGYSAHRDSDHLIEFVENASKGPLKKVFVTMGEPKSSLFLVQRLRDYIGIEAIFPQRKKRYLL
jgi:metallo-beta-lactamase family protein